MATALETFRIVDVAEIAEGEARCYCGKDARFVVTTDPDGEPGDTCGEHAVEWIELSLGLVRRHGGLS